jgi:hypothetical protein
MISNLFNDTPSTAYVIGYVSEVFIRKTKKVTTGYFTVLPQYLPIGTEGKH